MSEQSQDSATAAITGLSDLVILQKDSLENYERWTQRAERSRKRFLKICDLFFEKYRAKLVTEQNCRDLWDYSQQFEDDVFHVAKLGIFTDRVISFHQPVIDNLKSVLAEVRAFSLIVATNGYGDAENEWLDLFDKFSLALNEFGFEVPKLTDLLITSAVTANRKATAPGPANGTNVEPPSRTKQGEGGTPPADRSKGVPISEAEVRVREWLVANAKDNPAEITRDAVADGTRVSAGQVSNTAAWKAFRQRRDAKAKPVAREVPLSDAMQAVMPSNCEDPGELAALIEEQKKDKSEQERRHKRRHGPS